MAKLINLHILFAILSVTHAQTERQNDLQDQIVKNESSSWKTWLSSPKLESAFDMLNLLFRLTPEKPAFEFTTPPSSQWPGGPEYQYSRLKGKNFRYPHDQETFDYIVIGGGGAGCPLGRTLAEQGYKVVILERGDLRENHYLTWSINDTARAINDHRVAQPVLTTEGIITHVPAVLGGGTALNFGFYIEEEPEHLLDSLAGDLIIDRKMFVAAQKWVRDRIASPTKLKKPYSDAVAAEFQDLAKGRPYQGFSSRVIPGHAWSGYTLFDGNSGFRRSSDLLLGKVGDDFPPTLTVSVQTNVFKIEFKPLADGRHVATCVLIRPSVSEDTTSILGRPKGGVQIFQTYENFRNWLNWYPTVSGIAGRILPSVRSHKTEYRRICLDWKTRDGEIIVSAGALMTPWLLWKSGVGPSEELSRLGVKQIANVPELGKNLGDRPFVPIAYFFDKESEASNISLIGSAALVDITPGDLFNKTGVVHSEELNTKSDDRIDHKSTGDHYDKLAVDMMRIHGHLVKSERIYEPEGYCSSSNMDDPVREGKCFIEEMFESARDSTLAETYNHIQEHLNVESGNNGSAENINNGSAENINNGSAENINNGSAENINNGSAENINNGSAYIAAYEELSGGKVAEGAGTAMRYFFPPSLRSSVLVDLAVEIMTECGEEDELRRKASFARERTSPLLVFCPIVKPLLACFRRSAVQLWMLPTPSSRGFIRVGGADGKTMQVTGNYLRDPNDVVKATRGAAWLLNEMRNTDKFDGVYERLQKNLPLRKFFSEECPVIVRSHLSFLFDQVGQTLSQYLPNRETEVVEKGLEQTTLSPDMRVLASEIARIMESQNATRGDDITTVENLESTGLLRESETASFLQALEQQRYLSFPPVLPSPSDLLAVRKFVKRTLSSMWHWHGSAKPGEVIDPRTFNLQPNKLYRISIVDSSILSNLTRLNPQATIMALGRYAGIMKGLQRRQK